MLLTVSDFEDMTKRPVPPREGLPIVALDLGHSRSWCCGAGALPERAVSRRGLSPQGFLGLADQEQRDNVPRGTYQSLALAGVLTQADGEARPRGQDSHKAGIGNVGAAVKH